jgi:hypothetical protein
MTPARRKMDDQVWLENRSREYPPPIAGDVAEVLIKLQSRVRVHDQVAIPKSKRRAMVEALWEGANW